MCCVLLDLTMPQEDGNELFARIRERHARLPVIFMSGYEARSVATADGFLPKPFTMNDLREVLGNVLASPTGAPGLTEPPP